MTVENKLYVVGVPVPLTGVRIKDQTAVEAPRSLMEAARQWPPEMLNDSHRVPTDIFVSQPDEATTQRHWPGHSLVEEDFHIENEINDAKLVVSSWLGGIITRRVHWRP